VFRLNHSGIHQLMSSEDGPVGRHLARVAVQVESQAKQNCPVDTGRLRGSITWEFFVDDTVGVRIGTNVSYGYFVHEGTSRMAGRPFLADALDAVLG
jgi:hypothetical protein